MGQLPFSVIVAIDDYQAILACWAEKNKTSYCLNSLLGGAERVILCIGAVGDEAAKSVAANANADALHTYSRWVRAANVVETHKSA